jgi:hypothetical protein
MSDTAPVLASVICGAAAASDRTTSAACGADEADQPLEELPFTGAVALATAGAICSGATRAGIDGACTGAESAAVETPAAGIETAGEESPAALNRGTAAGVSLRPRTAEDGPRVASDPAVADDPPALEADRPRGTARLLPLRFVAAGLEASDGADETPVDPPEPVSSANAAGMDASAEPTPSATARAPIRPT